MRFQRSNYTTKDGETTVETVVEWEPEDGSFLDRGVVDIIRDFLDLPTILDDVKEAGPEFSFTLEQVMGNGFVSATYSDQPPTAEAMAEAAELLSAQKAKDLFGPDNGRNDPPDVEGTWTWRCTPDCPGVDEPHKHTLHPAVPKDDQPLPMDVIDSDDKP